MAVLAFAVSAQDAAAAEWDWVAAPYLWATSVNTNLREDAPPFGNDTAFSDIISKIDMAAQVHVEGQGDRFGLFGDLTFLSLSDDAVHANSTSSASLDLAIIEFAGVWNIEPARYEGWDLFAGLRHFGTEFDALVDPVNPAFATRRLVMDVGFTDLMVGARYNATLSERWGATLRLDGAGGDTDGTINASALFRYKMGNGSWIFGYRYMDVELDVNGRSLDLTMSGPIVAYAFEL